MLTLPVIDGTVFGAIPADALRCDIDGDVCTVWMPGDDVPIYEAESIEAVLALLVSPRQLRQALTRTGLRGAVEAAVAAADQDTRDWWDFATEFDRQHPLLVSMATQLGYTPQQVDQVFVLAASL